MIIIPYTTNSIRIHSIGNNNNNYYYLFNFDHGLLEPTRGATMHVCAVIGVTITRVQLRRWQHRARLALVVAEWVDPIRAAVHVDGDRHRRLVFCGARRD